MEKIPTATKFLDEKGKYLLNGDVDITRTMIEFAKLHVEAALKAASENVETKWVEYTDHDYEIDKESILNSYPSTNIK